MKKIIVCERKSSIGGKENERIFLEIAKAHGFEQVQSGRSDYIAVEKVSN